MPCTIIRQCKTKKYSNLCPFIFILVQNTVIEEDTDFFFSEVFIVSKENKDTIEKSLMND